MMSLAITNLIVAITNLIDLFWYLLLCKGVLIVSTFIKLMVGDGDE